MGLRTELQGQPWEHTRSLAYEEWRRVIAIDTNVLVYAHREDCPFHDTAAACLASCAEGRDFGRFPALRVVNPLLKD